MTKNALVVSGGGSRGAFAVGVLMLAACLTLLGCKKNTPVPKSSQHITSAPIRTEKMQYRPEITENGFVLNVRATYTNRTDSTVILPKCGTDPPRFLLLKRVGDEWTGAVGQYCPDIGVPPLRIEPGSTYVDTLRVHASFSPDVFPTFEPDEISGTYRFIWEIYSSWSLDPYETPRRLLPESLQVSNEFRIIE